MMNGQFRPAAFLRSLILLSAVIGGCTAAPSRATPPTTPPTTPSAPSEPSPLPMAEFGTIGSTPTLSSCLQDAGMVLSDPSPTALATVRVTRAQAVSTALTSPPIQTTVGPLPWTGALGVNLGWFATNSFLYEKATDPRLVYLVRLGATAVKGFPPSAPHTAIVPVNALTGVAETPIVIQFSGACQATVFGPG